MPIFLLALSVATLLLLIMYFRFNTFIALLLVSIAVGLAQGMEFTAVMNAIKNGVGGTLGDLALVLGLGAMLGAIIAESGAALRITNVLINSFGLKWIQVAAVLAGFIIGIPIFYNVGFIMLIPIIFSIAHSTKLPLLYVGIPMISALSVTHGFLPPHPAPTAIAGIYGADMSLTLLYGIIIGIPTVLIAGLLFGRLFKDFHTPIPKDIFDFKVTDVAQAPSFGISVFSALLPVLLMGGAAIAKLNFIENSIEYNIFSFLGDPVVALLIAVLFATYSLGIRMGKFMREVMESCTNSVKAIAMIMLIIAGGGAFKQVLIDSGISEYIVAAFQTTSISPLLLAWTVAAALRITLGSATVAALTAAGIAMPLLNHTDVSPELLVLATGAGSLTLSQVNDTGFWMFKEYFNLTIWQTLRSWTVMETIISIAGLIGCLLLNQVI